MRTKLLLRALACSYSSCKLKLFGVEYWCSLELQHTLTYTSCGASSFRVSSEEGLVFFGSTQFARDLSPRTLSYDYGGWANQSHTSAGAGAALDVVQLPESTSNAHRHSRYF